MEEKRETTAVVTHNEQEIEPQEAVVVHNADNFEETPSEMYNRIAEQPEEKEKPKEQKKNKIAPIENKRTNNKPSNTSERNDPVENIEKNRTTSRSPADVPAGKSISVTLMDDISSEEQDRDGTYIRLSCNENVLADNRVIIRKGAAVTGKIVDVIPSSNRRKKALIGFVILKVDAVDGSSVKLKSERFRLFSDAPGNAVRYRRGQTFDAILRKGRVQ